MKVAVVGAGGIGSCLGAALARVADVTLICRGAHLAAIEQRGLSVVSAQGRSVQAIRATDDPGSVGEVDVIISCVKLYDLEAVTRQCMSMMGPETLVIPTQNGVTAHEQISAVTGSQRVLGGTVFMSSSLLAPGVVELRSTHASMTFGELHGHRGDRTRDFARVCEAAGIRVQLSDDILVALWQKFIALGGTAAISCLARQSIGAIRSDPALRKLLHAAMAEVLALAQVKGVAVDHAYLAHAMAFADSVNPDTKISLLEDIEAGKRLELEWITGHIARESHAMSLACPINDIAYACTRHLATG